MKLKKFVREKTVEKIELKSLKLAENDLELRALETWNLKAKTWFFFKNFDLKNLYQDLFFWVKNFYYNDPYIQAVGKYH